MTTIVNVNRIVARSHWAVRRLRRWIDRVVPTQTDASIERQAAAYWTRSMLVDDWEMNSHWKAGLPEHWIDIGRAQLTIFNQLMRVLERPTPTRRVVEWGSGGGANAVQFAPIFGEYVAVDVVNDSLQECQKQVSAVTATPVLPVLIDMDEPEKAIEAIGSGTCDLFICFYVMELVPSRTYALRIVDIARELLVEGGVAVIQVKYHTTSRATRSIRRSYRRNLADMTTFTIDEFWIETARRGFTPHVVKVVPRDQLDERYAYYLLTRE